MTQIEKIKYIAMQYGYESQSRQCIEEMAELMQAINKAWRSRINSGSFITDAEHYNRLKDAIIEEMVDVEIVLLQMHFLLGIEEEAWNKVMNKKLDRQIARIKEEKDHAVK